ncbi:MAG: DPP IV N-terminal domain-containing protein, partial [Planctomycetota bacterium]
MSPKTAPLVHFLAAFLSACAAPDPGRSAPGATSATVARADDGAGKRAFTVADVYRVKSVGAPSVSPDGTRVAFQVRRYDLARDLSWCELWLMASDGSDARQMTQGEFVDTAPQFSRDGRTLWFQSNRSGANQLWSMPIDGGEPRQVTSLASGVTDPVFSPDEKYIAAAVELYPELAFDDAGQAGASGKLEVHVADELLYRHWTSWRDGRYTHVLLLDAATGKALRDLTPGRFDAPTFSLGGERGYVFSPDSKELCFVSNHDAKPAESTNSDLWVVPIDGAIDAHTARNLTDANEGWDGAPLYSPDGKYIAYVSQKTPGYESDLRRLALLERASGKVRYLTERDGFDDWIGDFAFDGEELVFSADRKGRNPLFRLSLAGGTPRELFAHGNIDHWELLPDGV